MHGFGYEEYIMKSKIFKGIILASASPLSIVETMQLLQLAISNLRFLLHRLKAAN